VQPLENKALLSVRVLMLSRKNISISIWAKHGAQLLIMLLEKQQWMPVIA